MDALSVSSSSGRGPGTKVRRLLWLSLALLGLGGWIYRAAVKASLSERADAGMAGKENPPFSERERSSVGAGKTGMRPARQAIPMMPERNIARLIALRDRLDDSRRKDALSDPRMKALLDLRKKHAPLQDLRHPDITRVRDWESAGEGPEEASFRDGIKLRADSLLETRALARIWCSAELQILHEGMEDSKRREFALLLIDRDIDPASFATPEGPSSEDAARILDEMSLRLEELLQDPRIPEGLFSQGYQDRREASRIDQEIESALERTQSDASRAIEEERMKALREGAEERSRIGRMRYMAGER